MGPDETEKPSDGDAEPTRRDLYELADQIAVDLAVAEPDWCRIAQDARKLADETERKCHCLGNDLTR
jgi:hypothetical protein